MHKKVIYEICIGILAIISVIFALLDITKGLSKWQIIIDYIILIIFISDYLIRLITASNKKDFIKNNILDLIAIIPFNSAFRIFRIFKFTKLIKIVKITKLTKLVRLFTYSLRFINKIKNFLNTNGFKYMLILTSVLITIGGIAIHYVEDMDFFDGIWWSFVTTTTVGYGDISPSTPLGRLIAMVLMLVGIGLIGSLTSTITSYFFTRNNQTQSVKDELIANIKQRLDNVNDLSDEDIDVICSILKTLNK
ncbi:potassium channel family protein [Diplocloster modestus]|uniref:Potassium channel family protein n=1 Tax=Diplocloster modestus TaxID=2850322 RepID=A0ABS6KCQ0_9FIRM|nr:potassium channel family protein [Diplocloster modestus]MBU9728301.1 potassium channel family protein [Diplocloster modestus]